MKRKPFFFILWLALVGNFHMVGLHRVKSFMRMVHYGNWSWIKFHCLQLLSLLSLNFTTLIAHLLQPPKISSLHILESKIKHKTRSRMQFFKTCNNTNLQEFVHCPDEMIMLKKNPKKLCFYFIYICMYIFINLQ